MHCVNPWLVQREADLTQRLGGVLVGAQLLARAAVDGEDRVLGLAVAFLAVEAAQLLIIAGAAWLVGAAAPSALAPAFAGGGGGRLVPPPPPAVERAVTLAANVCHVRVGCRYYAQNYVGAGLKDKEVDLSDDEIVLKATLQAS